jgi:hypothetical protein
VEVMRELSWKVGQRGDCILILRPYNPSTMPI